MSVSIATEPPSGLSPQLAPSHPQRAPQREPLAHPVARVGIDAREGALRRIIAGRACAAHTRRPVTPRCGRARRRRARCPIRSLPPKVAVVTPPSMPSSSSLPSKFERVPPSPEGPARGPASAVSADARWNELASSASLIRSSRQGFSKSSPVCRYRARPGVVAPPRKEPFPARGKAGSLRRRKAVPAASAFGSSEAGTFSPRRRFCPPNTTPEGAPRRRSSIALLTCADASRVKRASHHRAIRSSRPATAVTRAVWPGPRAFTARTRNA